MLLFNSHRGSYILFPSCQVAAFILAAGSFQKLIQFCQAAGLGHRRPVIPSKIPDLAFLASFLIPASRRAELRLKAPMGPEGDEPCRLFPFVAPQDLLHCTF